MLSFGSEYRPAERRVSDESTSEKIGNFPFFREYSLTFRAIQAQMINLQSLKAATYATDTSV